MERDAASLLLWHASPVRRRASGNVAARALSLVRTIAPGQFQLVDGASSQAWNRFALVAAEIMRRFFHVSLRFPQSFNCPDKTRMTLAGLAKDRHRGESQADSKDSAVKPFHGSPL